MFEYSSFALPIAWARLSKFLSTDNVNQNVSVLIFYGIRFKFSLYPRVRGLYAKIIATVAFINTCNIRLLIITSSNCIS